MDVPTTLLLSVDNRGAGKRSVLVFGDDEDEVHPQLSQPSARASERRQACDMETPLLSSVLSFESCYYHQVFPSSNPQLSALPMERFFTRRAGPPTTAWPERHDEEEDFLALVRHNAAPQLEMERWPPALKKRRVGKPTVDEQYTRPV